MANDHEQARAFWTGERWRPPTPPSQLRVSDAERNEVAEILSRNFGEGRLDQAEFNERVGLAMAAKTRSDLEPLLRDLPRPEQPDRTPLRRAPHRLARTFLLAFGAVLLLAAGTAFMRPPAPSLFSPHVPWLLIGVVVLLLARRSRHLHGHSRLL